MSAEQSASEGPVAGLLEQNMLAIDIPPRPRIIDRIRAAMNEEVPDLQVVSRLIGADVGLAAGLIKTANSPFFGFQHRARSVSDALQMLGLDAACRAVAAISLRQAFPGNTRHERFWDASTRIAVLSAWLAKRLKPLKLRPDDAYTYGLFRDCGIVIMLRRFPEYAATLARANNETEWSFTVIERQCFPTDHAVIGYLLAQNWWLPDEICLAIRHHHDQPAIDIFESGLPPLSRYLAAVGQTAEHLLQQASGASHTEEWAKLGASCLRLLSLDAAALAVLHEESAQLLATVTL